MKQKLLLFAVGLLFVISASAQSVTSISGTKSRSGDDPNIIKNEVLNSAKSAEGILQPEYKGGEPTRGSYCKVIFDNWTNLYLKCYVDGSYQGYVSPWGDGAVTVGAGETTAYAVAEFDDGSRLTWGPITRTCYGDWTLKIER
ncbi:MAG: hypothetical protein KGZ97_00050 [Bacteroidetes bacterium]|nr:hypothetical protein [Bacteroidota bacterium]